MSITTIILSEYQIHRNFEEAKNFLIDNGINLGEKLDYYIGSGMMGDVYKVKNTNKVLKIYNEPKEFEMVNKIMKSNKEFDHIVNYFFNKQIDELYICVMEYLEKVSMLTRFESQIISEIEDKYYMYKDKNITDVLKTTERIVLDRSNEKTFREDIEKLKQKINPELYPYFIMAFTDYIWGSEVTETTMNRFTKHVKILNDIFKGIKEYESLGMMHGDIHRNNILLDPKTKNFKLIDPFER